MASYAAGYLCCESAWKVAYYRGICSAELSECSTSLPQGAMMSVGLSESDAKELIATIDQDNTSFGISIACINSPINVTISGEESLIDQLKERLDEKKVFARKLRVALAYHSRQMENISDKYTSMIGDLSRALDTDIPIPMISSVTGERVPAYRLTDPAYWALNMVSPVQFSQAVTNMCAQATGGLVKKVDRSHVMVSVVDHLLEIGPHAALQGPLRDILRASSRGKSIGYTSILRRGQSAAETMLRAVGDLHCMGSTVNLRAINEPHDEDDDSRFMLVDLPAYPFDHAQNYWHESRLSKNYRLRQHPPSELLGVQSRDWNAADAKWRQFIRLNEMPWADQHVVNGTILYPGAGMLVMAIEAAKQLSSEIGEIDGYTLRDVFIDAPMDLTSSAGILEVQTSLREIQPRSRSGPSFEFAIRSYYGDDWRFNCRGFISVELIDTSDPWKTSKTIEQRQGIAKAFDTTISQCTTPVDSTDMYRFLKESGYNYGPVFQAVKQACNDGAKQASSEVTLYRSSSEPHVIHPATLDTILHLCFTAFTAGGVEPMATCIPTRIGSLWVSNEGLSSSGTETVTCCSTISSSTKRGFTFEGGALDNGPSKEVRLWFNDIDVTNVTSVPAPSQELSLLPDPKQFCMSIESQPALSKLSQEETCDLLDSMHPIKEDLSEFYRDLEQLALASLEDLVNKVDPCIFEDQEPWKMHYWAWAKHHLCNRPLTQRWNGSLQEFNERIANTNHVGRLYATVASNLVPLMKGEVTPLDLLMQSGLLKVYYEELATYRDNAEVASYLGLLAHQTTGLRVLEVGGGTASATRNFVRALSSGPYESATSLRCSQYDFTDVSSAFLENAREEFGRFQSQMTFGTLDVERDFVDQGYEEGVYDVVVADNVLHVTSDLGHTLQNVRKALKPGGKLIMHELLRPDGWTSGYIFGLFPGWWLGADDERTLSPNLGADGWDQILKRSGFSGTDLIFKDFDDEVAHHLGCLVSTATAEVTPSPEAQSLPSRQISVIIDPTSTDQQNLSNALLSLQDILGGIPIVQDLAEAAASSENRSADDLIIMLLDYGKSFLSSMNETTWAYLQTLIRTSNNILWASAGGGRGANPDHGLLDGLARTLRFESYELQLVTVALDISDLNSNKASHLVKVVQDMVSRAAQESYEQDYVEFDGRLHTRRLIEANQVKLDMESRIMPYEVSHVALGKARFGMASSSTPGLDSGPYYTELPAPSEDELEAEDTVEILVKAVAFGHQDRAAARDQEKHSSYGEYCAGIVLRAGRESAFREGDRVLAAQAGSFSSHVCVPSKAVTILPAEIPFAQACGVVSPVVEAYNALVEVGRTRRGDSILIHDGASPIGQAAVRFLEGQGITDVWVTASNESESSLVLEQLGISQERILPKAWFDNPSMLAAQWGQKFDIVLSPYADSASQMSMKTVKPGGRYIMLRAGSSPPGSSPSISGVPSSISLSILQPGALAPTAKCLRYAVDVAAKSTVDTAAQGVATFAASDLAIAFARLQGADARESIVVNLDESDMIDVSCH